MLLAFVILPIAEDGPEAKSGQLSEYYTQCKLAKTYATKHLQLYSELLSTTALTSQSSTFKAGRKDNAPNEIVHVSHDQHASRGILV